MLANYLKITLRSLTREKTYAFINLFGLAVGMAACLLIALYVRSESSYDRFHGNADRIYRVIEEFVPIQEGARNLVIATTPGPWAAALVNDYPEIEGAVRFRPAGRMLMEYEDERFHEERFAWTDSSVFDIFSFPLLRGDPATALASPNSIVISESAARRYFGDENPVGKTISANTRLEDRYEVTGVMRDMPARSHLRFDFLASMSGWSFSDPVQWFYHNYYTYLLLAENASAASVESKLPDFLDRHMGEALTMQLGTELRPTLQRLTRVHLHSSHINEDIAPQGDIRYVYVFSIIAAFVLLIACVNFMNLTTARSALRSREVGLRKVLGAQRAQLVRQFLGEALLLAFIALLAALALVWMLRPAVNHLSGGALDASTIDLTFVAGLVILTVVVGVLAGTYPALFLSGFRPIRVMKGEAGPTGGMLRKALVVFQFAISVVLIIGTVVVWRQLSYMQHKNLGFDEEQVMVMPIRGDMIDRYEVFRENLLAEPGIVEVGAASSRPGRSIPGNLVRLEGQEPRSMRMIWVDLHLAETLEMEIVAGRNLSERFPSDEESGFLINEAAAEQAGWSDPVGKTIEWVLPDSVVKSGTIVGVVRDFHIQPLDTPIEPLVMFVSRARLQHVFVRLAPGEPEQALGAVERHWTRTYPDSPFPFEYSFLDEHLDLLYEAERRLGRIFGTFAMLTIIIACLGLFGLAAFTAERRTREIGVRKVLGATVPGIVALLSKDFLPPIAMAFLLAAPIAYVVMYRWLESFAYRAELSVSIFLVAGLLTFMIALLTISVKSIRAALANPVESLRHE